MLAKELRQVKAELEALKEEHERCGDRMSSRDVQCCELEQEKRALEDEVSRMSAEIELLREVTIASHILVSTPHRQEPGRDYLEQPARSYSSHTLPRRGRRKELASLRIAF